MLIAIWILLIILTICLAIYVYKMYKYKKISDRFYKELDEKFKKIKESNGKR